MNRDMLQATIDRAQEQLLRLEMLNLDALHELEPGTVIWFEKAFTAGGNKYTYAFVSYERDNCSVVYDCYDRPVRRSASKQTLWAGTGPKAPKAYTTDELISFLSRGVDEVWVATEWERL